MPAALRGKTTPRTVSEQRRKGGAEGQKTALKRPIQITATEISRSINARDPIRRLLLFFSGSLYTALPGNRFFFCAGRFIPNPVRAMWKPEMVMVAQGYKHKWAGAKQKTNSEVRKGRMQRR